MSEELEKSHKDVDIVVGIPETSNGVDPEHIRSSLINADSRELPDSVDLADDCENEEAPTRAVGARGTWVRWVLLSFGNMFLFGSYYCYDIPSALSINLKNDLGLTDTQYNNLYAVYSFPNIVLPLFGGILCDKIGVKLSLMIFASFVTIG